MAASWAGAAGGLLCAFVVCPDAALVVARLTAKLKRRIVMLLGKASMVPHFFFSTSATAWAAMA